MGKRSALKALVVWYGTKCLPISRPAHQPYKSIHPSIGNMNSIMSDLYFLPYRQMALTSKKISTCGVICHQPIRPLPPLPCTTHTTGRHWPDIHSPTGKFAYPTYCLTFVVPQHRTPINQSTVIPQYYRATCRLASSIMSTVRAEGRR